MKKRLFSLLISSILLVIFTIPTANASEYSETNYIKTIYLPNGYYIVSTIVEENTHVLPSATSQIKSGSKTNTVHSPNGNSLYSITVYGTFSYNGSSATATSSSYSYTVDSPLWNFSNGSSSHSGSTATATATFKSELIAKTLCANLSCSANGVLS